MAPNQHLFTKTWLKASKTRVQRNLFGQSDRWIRKTVINWTSIELIVKLKGKPLNKLVITVSVVEALKGLYMCYNKEHRL